MDIIFLVHLFFFSAMFLWLGLIALKAFERRSRREIRPDILLVPTKVYLFWNDRQGFLFPDIWADSQRRNIDDGNLILFCLNLGQGAARNISFAWDYDVAGLCQKIMERDREKVLRIKHFNDHLCIDFHFRRERYPQLPEHCSIAFSERNELEIPYLLHAGICKGHQRVPLPKKYLTLVSLLHFIGHSEKASCEVSLCHLLLEYQDIEGFFYRFKYAIGFRDWKYCREEPGPNVLFGSADMFILEE